MDDPEPSTWLEQNIALQLRLCLSWLQDSNSHSEPGRWRGLYEDSGSCLDISCNDLDLDHMIPALQVIQLHPVLTLSDGRNHIRAALTPACEAHLATRSHAQPTLPTLHSIIPLRSYTLRYTSYGPPADKLRILLHSLDCRPSGHIQSIDSLRSIQASPEIASLFQKLDTARRDLDSKFSGSDRDRIEPTDAMSQRDPEQLSDNEPFLDHSDEPSQLPLGTQFDMTASFATQVPLHGMLAGRISSGRSRRTYSDGVPALIPVDHSSSNLEPISVGGRNNKQKDLSPVIGTRKLPPAANSREVEDETRSHLLALISKPNSAYVPPALAESNAPKAPLPEPESAFSPSNPNEYHAQLTQPQKSLDRTSDPIVIPAEASVPSGSLGDEPLQIESIEDKESAGQAPWMQGWHFNFGSITVSEAQQQVLKRPNSWHKPEIGHKYPVANMPIRIFEDIAEQAKVLAASEARLGGSDIIESSKASQEQPGISAASEDGQGRSNNIIEESAVLEAPSKKKNNNNSPRRSLVESPGSEASTSTGEMSWSQSSVPASPAPALIQDRFRSNASLPLDSDLDPTSTSQNQNEKDIPDADASAVDILASSPPVISQDDSDAETEMEVQVPQGLGEDITTNRFLSTGPSREDIDAPGGKRAVSIIQVKETPYSRLKNDQLTDFPRSPRRSQNGSSSGRSKDAPSTSVVPGTYHEVGSSAGDACVLGDVARLSVAAMGLNRHEGGSNTYGSESNNLGDTGGDEQDVHMIGTGDEMQTNIATSINETLASQHGSPSSSRAAEELDQKHAPIVTVHARPAKRKPESSPRKRDGHHPKRREIVIKGYGKDRSPLSTDPSLDYLRERENTLQRLRSEREISSVVKTEEDSNSRIHHTNDEIPPSRIAAPPANQDLYEQVGNSDTSHQVIPLQAGPPPPFNPNGLRHERENSIYHATQEDNGPRTIFQLFKDTYPEYTGDTKHFITECRKMYDLELQDKMVPKWQWDDYLIRNRLDYKKFAIEQLDNDVPYEEVMEYHRFYKDMVRDTKFTRGILKDAATLITALDELGQRPASGQRPPPTGPIAEQWRSVPQPSFPGHRSPRPTSSDWNYRNPPSVTHTPTPPSRGRQIRPSPFHTPNFPGRRFQHQPSAPYTPSQPFPTHLRHASGSRPSHQLHLPHQPHQPNLSHERPPSSSRPPRPSRQPQQPQQPRSPSALRDFASGFERMASLTGSKQVSKTTTKWPDNLAIRPSIARPSKVNVLEWGDTL